MNIPTTPTLISEPRVWRELVRPQDSLKSLVWDGASSQVVDLRPEESAALHDMDERVLRRINIARGDLQSNTPLELHRDIRAAVGRLSEFVVPVLPDTQVH